MSILDLRQGLSIKILNLTQYVILVDNFFKAITTSFMDSRPSIETRFPLANNNPKRRVFL